MDDNQYEEPINLTDLELSIIRDEQLHGIGFEASTLALNFIGDGAEYLENKKKTEGLKANIICRIEQNCGDDSGEWETVLEGKVNMGQYKKTCGDICMVSVPVESTSCEVLLNNTFDQAVDVDKIVAFDGMTALPGYFNLGVNMELPTKALDYKTEGYVKDEGDIELSEFISTGGPNNDFYLLVRPDYENEIAANIQRSELTGATSIGISDADNSIFLPISPQVLFDEPRIQCFSQTFKINGRLKGVINLPSAIDVYVNFLFKRGEIKGNLILDPTNDIQHIYADAFTPIHHPVNYSFDWTIDEYEWTPENTGSDSLNLFLAILIVGGGSPADGTGNITFDKESFFKATTLKTCPPTNTKAYMVHETLSRVTEAITNYCVRVKSSYYGRTDSEPFDFPNDGCGGLRFLTSGLKIRNAVNPTFFASPKDLIEGLQAIDNIGMGIEADPERPGYLLLRVEDLDFFYRNQEIMRCDGVAKAQTSIDLAKSYSKVNVGYKKWQTQNNFGLDEFNSTREFRTALTAVNATLDITSGLVGGEYPIELTREQQYVDSSEADTTYDNETFIILLKRITAAGYPYGEMVVEQGNISNPENIFSPSSVYNYGISPVRNLLRWFRSIAAAYPNIDDSDNKLSFNAGTGNILAKGETSAIYGGTCRLENEAIRENQDVAPTIFQDRTKATPLWRNEPVSYDYPMSLKDYKAIKANAYGYISYQCGNGAWEKGWITEISFKPFRGMGLFKLKKTWE